MDLKSQLNQICKKNLTISYNLTHTMSISHHMATIGAPISDHDMTLYLLTSIGHVYLLFVNEINMRELVSSLNLFHSMLGQCERMIKCQH